MKTFVDKEALKTYDTYLKIKLAQIFLNRKELPTKLSELINDKNFIDKNVDNLKNYYNKKEIENKIDNNSIEEITIEEINQLFCEHVSISDGKTELHEATEQCCPYSTVNCTKCNKILAGTPTEHEWTRISSNQEVCSNCGYSRNI